MTDPTKQTIRQIFKDHTSVVGLDNDGDGEPDLWQMTAGQRKEFEAALSALIDEVIGEDEEETWYNKDLVTTEQKLSEIPIRRRNHLRAEQRQRKRERMGETTPLFTQADIEGHGNDDWPEKVLTKKAR